MNNRYENKPLMGKNILFLGTNFFDYDTIIRAKLEDLGASVCYFWPGTNSFYYRILKRIGLKKVAERYADKLRAERISKSRLDNDYVFTIKGAYLNQTDLDQLKIQNPKAQFILYLWDDISRIDNWNVLVHNFSKIWSFDQEDCKKYKINFRPLFYREGLHPLNDKEYFVSSIGSCHSNRLELFRQLSKELDKTNYPYFLKLYIGKIDYFINRYLKKSILSDDSKLFITSPVPYDFVTKVTAQSRCVIDIPHASQRGLTIRTIEALKSGCHLYTTNESIKKYEDISPDYYTIFDPNSKDPFSLIINKCIPMSDISSHYSLESFLREIFMV